MKSFKDYLNETIRRYGAVGSSPAMGYSLAESHMAEADAIIQDIISGALDAHDVMTNPTTPEEQYVAKLLQQEYDNVAMDHRLHPDDDFDKILDIVIDNLTNDYKHPELEEDQSAGVLAAKELETDITNPMPGVHESKSVDNELYTIVRFAGLANNIKGK